MKRENNIIFQFIAIWFKYFLTFNRKYFENICCILQLPLVYNLNNIKFIIYIFQTKCSNQSEPAFSYSKRIEQARAPPSFKL